MFHLATLATALSAVAGERPALQGNAAAVKALVERKLPGSSGHFDLLVDPDACGQDTCFVLADLPDGRVRCTGTSASELSAGVGHYLRGSCNMTMGWAGGGGSNFLTPAAWPKIGLLCRVAVAPCCVPSLCQCTDLHVDRTPLPGPLSAVRGLFASHRVWVCPAGSAACAPGVTVRRLGRWSFGENVCTSSYTLVWHSWAQWE
eukprot:gene4825-4982_t